MGRWRRRIAAVGHKKSGRGISRTDRSEVSDFSRRRLVGFAPWLWRGLKKRLFGSSPRSLKSTGEDACATVLSRLLPRGTAVRHSGSAEAWTLWTEGRLPPSRKTSGRDIRDGKDQKDGHGRARTRTLAGSWHREPSKKGIFEEFHG